MSETYEQWAGFEPSPYREDEAPVLYDCIYPDCHTRTTNPCEVCREHRCYSGRDCAKPITPGYDECVDHAIESLLCQIASMTEEPMSAEDDRDFEIKIAELERLRMLA